MGWPLRCWLAGMALAAAHGLAAGQPAQGPEAPDAIGEAAPVSAPAPQAEAFPPEADPASPIETKTDEVDAGGEAARQDVADNQAAGTDEAAKKAPGTEAQPAPEEVLAQVRQRFESRFPGLEVSDVALTPFDGLYEVRIGAELLYTDREVGYVMQGALIDARTRQDLSAQRLASLSQAPFDSLPLQWAVKQVKGDGSRRMAVFEDPNCGYCKRLHQTLEHVDNVTVYTLLFPILSPDSREKARDVWCAPDQARAWRDWMLQARPPARAECETPIKDILALGRKLMVQGTPAIFFQDGTRADGALPLEALQQRLEASAKAAASAVP